MTWRVAKSLDVLLHQINARWPGRDKSSDGSIGDESHSARSSDHNPDDDDVVKARDFTHDPKHGLDARKLAETLVASRDERIKYVISNAEICSGTGAPQSAWTWRPYTGPNAHRHHVHVSVKKDKAHYDDERPWTIGERLPQEPDPKPEPQAPLEGRAAVLDLAAHSAIVHYDWKGRGRAPLGYIKGMALVYARLLPKLRTADQAAVEMARPVVGDKEHDALAWYDLHGGSGVERLRVLFALMIGLGMRESSGKFCEGRDRSADNVTADTAEAGLFQMSWDITRTVPIIKTVYDTYAKGSLADGLRDIFVEGVRCSETDYRNFGVGPGADYQKLAKERPAFAVEASAVGLRNSRRSWGPIHRKEAEVRPEAEALLRQIEALADKGHVA